MTERELGGLWAETKQAEGGWTAKLLASALSGLPDWLLLQGVVQLWEAKKSQPGKYAYDPSQLSGAQRFFIRMLARYAPECGGVLVLDELGYVEIPAKRALQRYAAKSFRRNLEPYSSPPGAPPRSADTPRGASRGLCKDRARCASEQLGLPFGPSK